MYRLLGNFIFIK